LKDFVFEKNKRIEGKEYIYLNPYRINLAEINTLKREYNNKDTYPIPLLRIYNYSKLSIHSVNELLAPPCLLSLSLGGIYNQVKSSNEDNLNNFILTKAIDIKLTGAFTVFEETLLSEFLGKLSQIVEQPYLISL
jgi:hypothetical protein